MIEQPSGFDFSGMPWASRMLTPLLLCSQCVQDICDVANIRVFKDGIAWCATWPDFKNLQESPAGFGDSHAEAVRNSMRPDLQAAIANAKGGAA